MNNEVIEAQEAPASAPVQVLEQTSAITNWLDKSSFDQLARVSAMLAKSSLVPQNYQNKPEDCLIAMDMASRIGTPPLMVMQNLYVVKGKPAWSGQACAAMVKNSGRFDALTHHRTGTKGADDRGCYYTAVDKRTGETLTGVEVTVAMAKAEGWYNSNPKWKNLTEMMLMYRAASFFAKEFCPDILMGCQTYEEVEDSGAAPKSRAEDLTDTIKQAMEEEKNGNGK